MDPRLAVQWTGRGDPLVYWRNAGLYFGYPECCVEAFLRRASVPSSFDGTGFRCCAACAVLPREEVLAGIASRRQHPRPFPDSRGFERVRDSLFG